MKILTFFLIIADIALIYLGVYYIMAFLMMSERGWEIKVALISITIVVFGILLPISLAIRNRKEKESKNYEKEETIRLRSIFLSDEKKV